ncbi:tryptophanase [Streptomyces rochei]|uniref:tryptophanase n=1 Tax=Streptomyces rochei TaxID=1928 RepID=UPI00362EC2C5
MEPYRIKAVEPIPTTTRQQRVSALDRVGYNLFGLRAEEVMIDLLTDSGTGALSAAQWAAGVAGDESYAGSRSFHRFREAVEELTSYPYILPVHQGRAAERVLFSALLVPGQITLSNTHFDTTRANVALSGCQARDLPCPRARNLHRPEPFKGDIDLDGLAAQLRGPDSSRIALVIMTLTNNGEGGQPVSMDNLVRAAALCREHGVPLFLDAARFAENAYLVTQCESAYGGHSPTDVAKEAFRLADGCLMSAKKDGIVHIGGFLGLRDEALARRCELTLIATEGFPTYGGLAGRDLEMITQGLTEALDPRYLRSRAEAAAHLAALCRGTGVRLVEPPGLHALYLDAGHLLPHIAPHRFPGHALACALYVEGGIRSVELGSLYLGKEDSNGVPVVSAPYELLRLALPRRTYTRTHLDHVGQSLEAVVRNKDRVPGYRIVEDAPLLRHFRARLEPVLAGPGIVGTTGAAPDHGEGPDDRSESAQDRSRARRAVAAPPATDGRRPA